MFGDHSMLCKDQKGYFLRVRLIVFATCLSILPFLLVTCEKDKVSTEEGAIDLTILYTNDEHGWMEETDATDGAAKLMGIWRDREGYIEDDAFLILSGGDNWTGPAISTWFKGESMIEVMNAMHYDAAAIGNHEFDFNVSGLKARIDQALFPYLSANIRLKGTDSIPDFVLPYTIIEANNIQVGIIGLTTTTSSYSAFPAFVEDFDFIDYESALQEIVPQIWGDGAEIVLCIAHICYSEMRALAPTAEALGISMIGGGHCNQLISEIYNGNVALIVGGWQMANYARLDISFSEDDICVIGLQAETGANINGVADTDIESIVNVWQQAANEALGEVVGYVDTEIPRYSPQMHNLVTDSWLATYSSADIAITNSGGIRQQINIGDITKGDIVGVLPFDNNILELKLTGSEVINCLGNNVVAGITTTGGAYLHADGTPLKADNVYSVLTTDYLYIQDASNFRLYDSDPYYTGMNYHQPTVDYIKSLNTSASDPLDNYLDYQSRR